MSAGSLPSTAPLEHFLRARALLSREAFLHSLPGNSVLVRLDERGGADEPVPWAFCQVPATAAATLPPVRDDLFALLSATAAEDATGPVGPPPLPAPASRERATTYVVPVGDAMIGRASHVAVRIDERSISRHHALLRGATLVDQRSRNGCVINGVACPTEGTKPLRSGDVIEFGDVAVVYLSAQDFWRVLPRLAGETGVG